MTKLLKILTLSLTVLVLTGCTFPSERMYIVENCEDALCGFMPNNSEFAFVKQANGSNYEIWVNQQPDDPSGPMLILPNCEAPVSNDKFECDLCGSPGSFSIEKDGGCSKSNCVTIAMTDTPECPAGGGGKGGHN